MFLGLFSETSLSNFTFTFKVFTSCGNMMAFWKSQKLSDESITSFLTSLKDKFEISIQDSDFMTTLKMNKYYPA